MDKNDSNNKGNGGTAKGKGSRFRSKSTTLKPIILSTFLIVLPIALYWFVQIQNHQEYEQDKIYRTLRELELHISKELSALEGLERVLPLESVLPGKLYKQQKDRRNKLLTNLHPCSALILEDSGFKSQLKIETTVSGTNCRWNNDTKEEVLLTFKELKTSFDSDKQSVIEDLNDLNDEKSEGIKDIASDFNFDIESPARLGSLCLENAIEDTTCTELKKMSRASSAVKAAASFADILANGVVIYEACESVNSALSNSGAQTEASKTKSSKNAYKKHRTYSDKLVYDCEEYRDNLDSLFEDFVDTMNIKAPRTTQEVKSVANTITEIIDVFYDTLELVSTHLVDLEGSLKQRVAPFQKILKSSNMCVFISADHSSISFDKVSVINRGEFYTKFSSDIASCSAVLEGKNIIIIKKSLKDYSTTASLVDSRSQTRTSSRRALSRSNRTDKPEESNVVWLAVGVDSILKRYRRTLTYMEDIFLIDNSGEVFASFLGANKNSATNTSDYRILNLKPLLNEAIENNKAKTPESEKHILGKVELNEIGHSANQGRAIDPAWSYQASLIVEGAEYHAMVKPTSISLRDSKSVYKKNKLLLVGLKKPNQINLMTERLSPLFHFTVLFLALLLLLTMPVLHVILTRKHNSYSAFSVGLFKVAVSLSVIVTFSSFSGYFTMLKHNLYSAELLDKTADKLLDDWQKERNAAIKFMKSVEHCVFKPVQNDIPQEANCPEYFKPSNLLFYKEYEQINGNDGNFASRTEGVDSYVYRQKGGLPMLGLVFYTDENGIKEKPDWMARDYVPVRNKKVNLSQRNYFKTHRNQLAWKFSANDKKPQQENTSQEMSKSQVHQDYFVERIYNYIDGRKITQLSIPRTVKNTQENTGGFNGIVSGEIMALTLESPILPPAMRYAVVEKSSGQVLFHSEKEKVLVENFYDEMDDTDLAHAIRLNSESLEMIVYRSKKVVAYSRPIPNTNWSLILLYDSSVAHGVVNEVAISVMIVLVILAVLACAITYGLNLIFNNVQAYLEKTKVKKIKAIRFEMTTQRYALIVVITAIIFALVYNLLATGSGLIFVLAYLVLNFLLSTRCLITNEDKKVKAGNWLRTRPEYLTLFLVTLLALPSLTMFIRWYNISTHQLQAYNYFQIQQKLNERKAYLENYRNVFWYENDQDKQTRWLNAEQQRLGMFAEYQVNKSNQSPGQNLNQPQVEVTYDASKILAYSRVKPAQETSTNVVSSSDDSFSVFSTEFNPSDKTNQFLLNNTATCLAHVEKDDETHQQWRSIPPLGQLAMLAYHIDGQHCAQYNPAHGEQSIDSLNKLIIRINNQLLGDVLSPEIAETDHHDAGHRVTRLKMSESLMYLFMVGLIVMIYIYTRRLISGVWTKDWLSQAYYSSKKSHQFSYPKHRLFISPEVGFVEELMKLLNDNGEKHDSSEITAANLNGVCHAVKESNGKAIRVYLNVDLVAMDYAQRKQLLIELESQLCRSESIIWMTADISPLYRLMKSRAYPKANEASDISQAEVLRWANLFSKFYKDYHNGRRDKLNELFANPNPTQKDPRIPKNLEAEFNGFYPDLRWIWNVSLSTNEKTKTLAKAAEVCSIYAGPYYRFKWESCTRDERLVLYQVATGRYPSPKNNDVIEHLLRRGYLHADPFLQVANKSFQSFILNAELQDTFDEWEDEAEKSSWQQIRIYVGVLILLILAWLAYTSQDTYQQIAYLVGSLLTVFTALTQGANLLNLGGAKDGE
ncbi:hypothetical protein FLL45_01970 [Aliikangiella marina]|uniref:Uncharacterized protein n=1 Tax=Aliikangiella marina TaxID=1712262 RepID=A0A545THR4_9GAMM|nr:hypothetical protein [Aliikangiella marina]TQV76748.1 hypothetical protein FLL45_01970 [Aliikangiella marina]